jgi:hypothetical protein
MSRAALRSSALLALAVLVLGALAFARSAQSAPTSPPANAAARGSTERSGPRLELEALDGALRTIAPEELAQGPAAELGLRGWNAVFLRPLGFEPARLAPASEGEPRLYVFELEGGQGLRARPRGGDGSALELELAGGARLRLPLETLRSARASEAAGSAGGADASAAFSAPEQGDRLYRRVGSALDRIDGTLIGFEADGLAFESSLGARSFAWSEVAALFLEALDEDEPARASDARSVALALVDGSRLRAQLASMDAQGVRLGLGEGAEIALHWSEIEEMRSDDGSVEHLGELPYAEPRAGAAFDDDYGMRWPAQRDRNALGAELRVGGRVHARGIGVHAPSLLRFELDGSWDELRASVAIDDSALRLPERGSVVFRVRLDGALAWESPLVRGGELARELPPIDLRGKRALELEVDMASEHFTGDRANWLRPLLVRRSAPASAPAPAAPR